MTRGRLLVFEGIDASGKSSQAARVAHAHGALLTFEPGDTALGEQLRRWLLDGAAPMAAPTEALLMLADRAHHVDTVIEPTLRGGRSVVSDRYSASTLAYQGYGRGVDLDELRVATSLAVGRCRADLTILIDVTTALAHERRERNGADRFESADAAFHERVRQGYLQMADDDPEQWVVIDGSQSEALVTAAIDEVLDLRSWPHA